MQKQRDEFYICDILLYIALTFVVWAVVRGCIHDANDVMHKHVRSVEVANGR